MDNLNARYNKFPTDMPLYFRTVTRDGVPQTEWRVISEDQQFSIIWCNWSGLDYEIDIAEMAGSFEDFLQFVATFNENDFMWYTGDFRSFPDAWRRFICVFTMQFKRV